MAFATARDNSLVAKSVQRLGESAPDTRTAASDEDCIASEFHLFSFVLVGYYCFVRPPERMKKSLESAGQFAAIYSDGRTRDEGGLVRSEKHNGLGNLFGQPCTFKWHTRNQCSLLLLIAGEPVQHPGLDGARGNYVDPHARPSYLQRSRLGQAFDRVLARDVNRRAGPTSPSKDGRHVDDAALPTR